MNPAKQKSSKIPSPRPIMSIVPSPRKTSEVMISRTIEANIPMGISHLMFVFVRATGANSEVMPKMANVLKMFEPMTFPMATSLFPWNADRVLTTNSGMDVPMATIVNPMTNSEMLNLWARAADHRLESLHHIKLRLLLQ